MSAVLDPPFGVFGVCVGVRASARAERIARHGATTAFARFALGATAVVIGGEPVPQPVLRLAERCGPGSGQYADSAGRVLDWMGCPLGW